MPLSHPVSPKYTEGPGKVKTFCQQDPFSKALRPAMNDLEVALLSPKHWQHRLTWVNSKKNTMIYCQENMPATWTFAVPYRYDARRFLQFCPGHVLAASFCWHFVGFHAACTHASSGDGSCTAPSMSETVYCTRCFDVSCLFPCQTRLFELAPGRNVLMQKKYNMSAGKWKKTRRRVLS